MDRFEAAPAAAARADSQADRVCGLFDNAYTSSCCSVTFMPGLNSAMSVGSGVAGGGAGNGCGGTHCCAGDGATDESTREPGRKVAQPTEARTKTIAVRCMVAELPSECAIRMKGRNLCARA